MEIVHVYQRKRAEFGRQCKGDLRSSVPPLLAPTTTSPTPPSTTSRLYLPSPFPLCFVSFRGPKPAPHVGCKMHHHSRASARAPRARAHRHVGAVAGIHIASINRPKICVCVGESSRFHIICPLRVQPCPAASRRSLGGIFGGAAGLCGRWHWGGAGRCQPLPHISYNEHNAFQTRGVLVYTSNPPAARAARVA